MNEPEPTILGPATDAPDGAPLRLRFVFGGPEGESLQLHGDELLLGRGGDCDLRFDPHRDRMVSTRHARIARDGHGWALEDLGSTNGTHVNGAPVAGPTGLGPGDEVVLGTRGQEGSVAFVVVGDVADEGCDFEYPCPACGTVLAGEFGRAGARCACPECGSDHSHPAPGVAVFRGQIAHEPPASPTPRPRREEPDDEPRDGAGGLFGRVKDKVRAHVERRDVQKRLESLRSEIEGLERTADRLGEELARELWSSGVVDADRYQAADALLGIDLERRTLAERRAEVEALTEESRREGEAWRADWERRAHPAEESRDAAAAALEAAEASATEAAGVLRDLLTPTASALEDLARTLVERAHELVEDPTDEQVRSLPELAPALEERGRELSGALESCRDALEGRATARDGRDRARVAADEARDALEALRAEEQRQTTELEALLAEGQRTLEELARSGRRLDESARPHLALLGRELLERQDEAAAADGFSHARDALQDLARALEERAELERRLAELG